MNEIERNEYFGNIGLWVDDNGEAHDIEPQSERAEVVETAIREDELDDLRKLESSLLSMLDELQRRIREQVERQTANDEAHCTGRAEMETLAAWSPDEDEELPKSSSWWLDTPIPFALTPKALDTLAAKP